MGFVDPAKLSNQICALSVDSQGITSIVAPAFLNMAVRLSQMMLVRAYPQMLLAHIHLPLIPADTQ
jgi:hypothetical protein